MTSLTGLTDQQAQQKRQQGLGNDVKIKTGRSYLDIVRSNLFTLFNNILFVIGAALISMGRVNDAITSVGIGLVNACISTIQEIRAKRQLDQISLLAKPRVIVLRDGKEREIDPSEIVQEDILSVRAGDRHDSQKRGRQDYVWQLLCHWRRLLPGGKGGRGKFCQPTDSHRPPDEHCRDAAATEGKPAGKAGDALCRSFQHSHLRSGNA